MTDTADRTRLDGLAAVVTGSARNLGRATALALAEAGAAVMINARSSQAEAEAVADEIRAKGGHASVHLCDVSDSESADRLIAATVATFGRLDILVNNVGVRRSTSITETTDEDWRAVMAGCMDATFYCCRAAVPHLRRNPWGGIVNIGGVSGHAGVAGRTHVGSAKAGIAGFTAALAAELAPDNITVNCIAPGHIETERNGGELPPHFKARHALLGRPGEPYEIAETVRFLCSPGGRYITGETIHVNGGWYITIA
jgi:3-oxoacyl-[acyl-carrier protein] reductase